LKTRLNNFVKVIENRVFSESRPCAMLAPIKKVRDVRSRHLEAV